MKVRSVVSSGRAVPTRCADRWSGLARSTFFTIGRDCDSDRRAELKIAITEVFDSAHGRYVPRHIHCALTGLGWRGRTCSR